MTERNPYRPLGRPSREAPAGGSDQGEREARAIQNLLAGRPRIDDVLRAELEAPGSDQRGGVNLIVRPPADVLELVSRVQGRLREREPSQYHYPADDLHLTLVEICHGRTLSEAGDLGRRVAAVMDDLLAEASPFCLDHPRLGFDDGGVALTFLPIGDALQSTRRAILEVTPRPTPSRRALSV